MPELLTIVRYPDPFLRRRAKDIGEIDKGVREAVSNMFETMSARRGVGLAAPQVGISSRIVVFCPSGEKKDEKVLINPMIVEHRGGMEAEEGCLSFPEVFGIVRRHSYIKILAYDLEGNDLEITASDFLARVLQHEIDHLEGTLFIDRMTPESRVVAREALKALEDAYQAPVRGEGRES
jgi:peptide deformylase